VGEAAIQAEGLPPNLQSVECHGLLGQKWGAEVRPGHQGRSLQDQTVQGLFIQ